MSTEITRQPPINLYNEILYLYLSEDLEYFSPIITGITTPNSEYKMSRPAIHPYFSIEYVYEGKGIIKHGNNFYEAKQHDAFILHANTSHDYHSDSQTPWKKIWFVATGSYIESLISIYQLKDTVVIPNYNCSVYFEKIYDRIREHPFENRAKLALLIHNLFYDMSLHTKKGHKNTTDKEALDLKHFIDSNLYRKITRDELVAHIYSSPSTVTRVFKKNFNQTPFDYILDKKIEIAKKYLINTSYTIDNIANLLGFNNRSHLSSTFKKRTGVSPQTFKQNFNSNK